VAENESSIETNFAQPPCQNELFGVDASQLAPHADETPDYASVRSYLLYTLSLPERTLRSGAGLVGGALREATSLLVPQAFQNSTTYSIMVRQMLDFVVHDMAGVRGNQQAETPAKVENFVARKAVGNFLEMAGWATFHLSPMTVLAVVSDVAYGSQAYLQELSDELKRQGVIDQQSTIDHVDDLLAAVASASQTTATAFDTPPLSVEGLKDTIDKTRQAVAAIDPTKALPQAEIERLWTEMHELATREGVGVLEVSSTMTLHTLSKVGVAARGALSGVRVAGTMVDRHVLSHYASALGEIRQRGLHATLSTAAEPYIEAVWYNFSSDRATLTEDLLSGKMIGQAWSAVRRWIGGDDRNEIAPAESCRSTPDAATSTRQA
jgi:hypothetical protein